MRKNLCRLMIVILLLLLLTGCASKQSNAAEITNGVYLGMTLKEATDAANKANNPIDNFYCMETKIAEKPYSIVLLSFVDNMNCYNSGNEELEKSIVLSEGVLDMSMSQRTSFGSGSPLTVNESEASKILIQACVLFTADKYFNTAITTFDEVEEYLTKKYSETRYTSTRGESLPMILGYSKEFIPPVISQNIYKDNGGLLYSVPYYSQREIALNDSQHIIIDHCLKRNEKSNQFSHRLTFTLVPGAYIESK